MLFWKEKRIYIQEPRCLQEQDIIGEQERM